MISMKTLLKFSSFTSAVLVLISGLAFAKSAQEQFSEEALRTNRQQKSEALRELSNTFADYQTKAAYLRRDRAMLQQDAADPMLSEKQRMDLQDKIARMDSEITSLSGKSQKSQAAFAAAAKDYEGFMKENFVAPEGKDPSPRPKNSLDRE